MKKRDIITLVILVVLFGIIFLIMYFNKDEEEDASNKTEFNKLTLLTDETTFLSVSNSVNKICEYANSNPKLLDFIVKDSINSDNYINMSFEAELIYVVSELNLYKYYIKGNFYQELMDQEAKYIKTEYFILNHDINTSSFNIELINSKRFDNASEEKFVFEIINNNDYNHFEFNTISPKTRAIMYFNDFLTKLYSSTEEAYELLSIETKSKYFTTYEEFASFIKQYNNINLKSYNVNNNQIAIKDNNNIEYIFDINYILNYVVTINLNEEKSEE